MHISLCWSPNTTVFPCMKPKRHLLDVPCFPSNNLDILTISLILFV